MSTKSILVLAFCCGALLGSISCDEYLKEKPDYMKTCSRKSDDFDKCMVEMFENIFTSWKNGIPGIESSKPIDPMFVANFDVIDDKSLSTPISIRMFNITSTGLGSAKIQNVSMRENEYNFKMTYKVPETVMKGDYTAKGQIMLLKLDTSGLMTMNIQNGGFTVAVKLKLRQQDNLKFFDVKALRLTINSIENLKFTFTNLFKDPVLNDNTNALFNERWRLIFDIFKPKIEEEISSVLLAHYRNTFQAVPAHYFIAEVANDN